MIITPLRAPLIPAVEQLIGLGAPYVRLRTESDYWLYAELFSSSCPVAIDNEVIGVVIAFRSQDKPGDVYVQDVMTDPVRRRCGIARSLMGAIQKQASAWGCERLYLTSEPENTAAHRTWLSLGFSNVPGDHTIDGVSVISHYKGPGKDRAVYELNLT
ncbi:MAG TPA: GNAT family N-acetyltransferase [Pseudonocardiaceae bacterium]|nr:GNAT family N-acetyltransferase [Pseudonocardiaceae bacterium]